MAGRLDGPEQPERVNDLLANVRSRIVYNRVRIKVLSRQTCGVIAKYVELRAMAKTER